MTAEVQSPTDWLRDQLMKNSDSWEMRRLDSGVVLVGFIITLIQGTVTIASQIGLLPEVLMPYLALDLLILLIIVVVPYRVAVRKKAIDLQIFVYQFLVLMLIFTALVLLFTIIVYFGSIYASIGIWPRFLTYPLRLALPFLIYGVCVLSYVLHRKYVQEYGIGIVKDDNQIQFKNLLSEIPGVWHAALSLGFTIALIVYLPIISIPQEFEINGHLRVSDSLTLIGALLYLVPIIALGVWSVFTWHSIWERKITDASNLSIKVQKQSLTHKKGKCSNCGAVYYYDTSRIDTAGLVKCQNCGKSFVIRKEKIPTDVES